MTGKGRGRRGLSSARDWALRHPVVLTLIAAVAIRLAAAVFISTVIGLDQDVFSDVETYDRLAAERADGRYHDWGPRSELLYDRFATYVLPLSILYRAFGTHLFFGQLLAALAGAVTAALTCRLLLMVTAPRWALFGGAIVAFLPSQVVWSSTVFRDSFIWMVTAAMALACAVAARARGWKLAGLAGALAMLAFLLGHLRWSTMIVACWALMVAAVFSLRTDRLARIAGAAVIALLVPWYVGAGPAGLEYVADSSPTEIRVERTAGADSAIIGATSGDLAHFPRGLSVVLLEPFPGTSFTGGSVRLAQLELVFWYPLMLVALVGIPEAFRRRRLLAFSIVTGGTLVVVYALSEGNFGTAFRHRGELVPPTAVLAALGAPTLVRVWRPRRERTAGGSAPVVVAPR
ncbi:MAG: hypothetical protein ACRDY4_05225 [Acidimicrobiia bacterium]